MTFSAIERSSTRLHTLSNVLPAEGIFTPPPADRSTLGASTLTEGAETLGRDADAEGTDKSVRVFHISRQCHDNIVF